MTRHWDPKTRLSGDAYDRLSPLEKKRLWRERGHARAVERNKGVPRHRAKARKPSRSSWATTAIIPLSAIAFLLAWQYTPGQPALSASGQAQVRASFHHCKWGGGTNCVVDGDTIYLEGQKIRIAGIDAPETHDYGCSEELALGERAAERLQQLLNGGAITLTSIDRDEDVYGRKLRDVAVNGSNVGDTLINEGLARPYGGGRRSWCA